MKITLLAVGKNKEAYVREALREYEKRINKYAPFTIEAISGVKNSKKYSEQEIKKKEGQHILNNIPLHSKVVVLDERGEQKTSREFAQWLQKAMTSGARNLVFIIGGAYGIPNDCYQEADWILSLSKMTLSHQITRIVFAEQLYRAFTIIKGEPYHHG